MRRKRSIVLVQVFLLVFAFMPKARADLWSGVCEVAVTVTFATSVLATNTNPDYTISMRGLADLNLNQSGVQSCFVSLDPAALRETNGFGTGDSSMWTCTSVVSSGRWDQEWLKGTLASPPPMIDEFHTLKGTWDAWTLQVNNSALSVVGVAQLTLLDNNLKLADCQSGGIRVLSMVGTMVFQDP